MNNPGAVAWILHRERNFDTPEEIAFHPVSAGQIQIGYAVIMEVVYARVFQKAANN